jgi:formylglycine-generating enzyme required for sulfatase activity
MTIADLLSQLIKTGDGYAVLVDHFPADVRYTYSKVLRLLRAQEPPLDIYCVHGDLLARRLQRRGGSARDFKSAILEGILESVPEDATAATEIFDAFFNSQRRRAFIVTFYDSHLESIDQVEQSGAAEALTDFCGWAAMRGYPLLFCLPRLLLAVPGILTLFDRARPALTAAPLFQPASDSIDGAALLWLQPELRRLFRTNSPGLTAAVQSFFSTAGNEILPGRKSRDEEVGPLLALARRLTHEGFIEIAFRLELYCCSRYMVESIPLEADVETTGLVIGIVRNTDRIPAHFQCCVLSGRPGAGKSILLARLRSLLACPPPLIQKRVWLPVLVHTDLGATIADVLCRSLSTTPLRADSGIGPDGLDGENWSLTCHLTLGRAATVPRLFWLFSSPVYLLIDNLDALSGLTQRALVNELADIVSSPHTQYGYLVAVRSENFKIKGAHRLTLRELDARRVRDICELRGRLDVADALLEYSPAMRSLRTPFALRMLCSIGRYVLRIDQTDLDQTDLCELISKYVQQLVWYANRDPQRHDDMAYLIDTWLPEIAFRLTQRDCGGCSLSTSDENFLERGKVIGILRQTHGSEECQFSDTLFLDYFAAKYLARHSELPSAVLRDPERMPGCAQALAMLLRLLAPADRARLIQLLGEKQFTEAASLILAARPSLTPAEHEIISRSVVEIATSYSVNLKQRRAAADSLDYRDPRIGSRDKSAKQMSRLRRGRFWSRSKSVWIGKYLVTNYEYGEFVKAKGYEENEYWKRGWFWRRDNRIHHPAFWHNPQLNRGNYPVVGVSFFEALAYCAWRSEGDPSGLTYSLPTAADWDQAAHGTLAKRVTLICKEVSKSARRTSGVKNDHRLEEDLQTLLTAVEKPLKKMAAPADVNGPLPIGSLPPNEMDCYDLFAGTWQWCDSWVTGSARKPSESAEPGGAVPVITKGGPTAGRALVWLLFGGWFDPTVRYERLGFRICARPT